MKWLPLIIVVVIVLYVTVLRTKAATPEEAASLLEDGALFIDVRTPAEFTDQSVPGSVNYPLNEIEDHIAKANPPKDKPILLFCRSGRRSGIAMEKLQALGYTQIVNVGGFGDAMKVALLKREREE